MLTDTCLRGSGVLLLLALGVLAIVETSGTAHFWSWWWTLSVAFAWTIYVVAYPQLRRCTGFILNEYRGPLGAEVMVPPPKLAMCVVAALGCSLVMFGSMRILDNNTCLWWDRSEFTDAYALTGCDTASHCGTYVKTDTFCDCVPAYQTGGSDGPVLYRMIESLKDDEESTAYLERKSSRWYIGPAGMLNTCGWLERSCGVFDSCPDRWSSAGTYMASGSIRETVTGDRKEEAGDPLAPGYRRYSEWVGPGESPDDWWGGASGVSADLARGQVRIAAGR